MSRTTKDFWIEMSIREISTQAHFSGLAYSNIDAKAAQNTDAVFTSIHSFLSHCAMISKLLKAKDDSAPPTTIGGVLGIPETDAIHNRRFRNHLEHYDERLKEWIGQRGASLMIGTYNIGPKSAFQIPGMLFVSHYDPGPHVFTFVDEDFHLGALATASKRIQATADAWIKNVAAGAIVPPFH